jgi:hypothetical protein
VDAGFCLINRRIFPQKPHKNVTHSHLVFGTAKSSVAITVPIPVLHERTRTFLRNLLTRGPVLGQPN